MLVNLPHLRSLYIPLPRQCPANKPLEQETCREVLNAQNRGQLCVSMGFSWQWCLSYAILNLSVHIFVQFVARKPWHTHISAQKVFGLSTSESHYASTLSNAALARQGCLSLNLFESNELKEVRAFFRRTVYFWVWTKEQLTQTASRHEPPAWAA